MSTTLFLNVSPVYGTIDNIWINWDSMAIQSSRQLFPKQLSGVIKMAMIDAQIL